MVSSGSGRERLERSAAGLLASRGLGFTSLRAIIRDAGVNLNALHYHFGSADGLYSALVDRAMGPLNDDRLARLAALRAGFTVIDVIDAAYRPLFERALQPREPIERHLLLVMQQIRHAPSRPAREALEREASRFVEAVEPAAARAGGEVDVRERMVLVNSLAWDTALRPDVWERVSTARHSAGEADRVFASFASFAAAGFESEVGG